MNAKLATSLSRIDRMSKRERLTVTLCLCIVIWYIGDLMLSSAKRDLVTYSQLADTQQEELTRASTDLDALRSGKVPAGDPALHAQLAQLEQQTQSVGASLRASQQYLVLPETMSALLQDLLRRDRRLELVAVHTLPATPILQGESVPVAEASGPAAGGAQSAAVAQPETNMFRHGVEFTVRGDYLNVLTYLQEVEKLPWRMYWGRFAMEASEAGPPTFHFSIYTLSLDKSWLQI